MVIEFRKLFKDKIKFMEWYGGTKVWTKKKELLYSPNTKEMTFKPKLNKKSIRINKDKAKKIK